MGRQKGIEKTGGRQKGTPNKNTAEVKQWVANFIEKNQANFEKDFELMEPQQRVATFEKLLAYVIPKQQSFDINQEYKALELLLMKAPEKAIEAISLKIIELHNRNTENENETD